MPSSGLKILSPEENDWRMYKHMTDTLSYSFILSVFCSWCPGQYAAICVAGDTLHICLSEVFEGNFAAGPCKSSVNILY